MANEQEKLLADFELRMRQLMFLCDSLKKQNETLQEELKRRDQKIESLESLQNDLNIQYNNLKFAKTMQSGGSNEEAQKAKERLSKLVRDIDKCIALLKK